jgi:signal transduction histidine kinase/CheY-like chemotaxis protein
MELDGGLILGLAGALSGALMAALAFALSRAPGWRQLRSFALLALFAAAYCLFGLVHVVRMSPSTQLLGERLMLAASFAYGLAMVRHLAVMDGRPLRRWERTTLAIGAVLIVLALVPGLAVVPPIRPVRVEWFGVTYSLATGTTLAFVGVAFVVGAMLVAAFGSGRRWRDGWDARLPMIGTSTLAAAGVSDTLASLELIPVPQLIEGLTVVVVGSMGVSYAQRFIADARRLEALSTRLEHEVASRTDELLRAQTRAAEHERLAGLGRIAAGVAHEINNPTAVLQQNLDRMRAVLSDQATLPPELEERLVRCRAATQRIAEIVRQLLDTARAPATDPANATVFSIAEVVDRAIAGAGATAPALRVSAAIAPTLCARGEPHLLEQVLINLLVNAAHAAQDAPGGGWAQIDAVRDGERVKLTVKDNGPGISPAIRDRLFEPFATTKPVGQGTGLGLAVSRGLMTRQGGALLVASSTERGTEMAVELRAADPVEGPSADPPPPAVPSATQDLRVLVIDDNDDLREVLSLQLGATFLVEEVASVALALDRVAEGRRYDAVLCDLMMPGGGAVDWLSACASLDPELGERTLLMTGGPTTPQTAALVAAAGDRVLLKPVELADLQQAITRVANREHGC